MQKQITFKTDEDAVSLFERMYSNALAENTNLTKGAFFEEMVNGYANPKTKPVPDPADAQRIAELETLLETATKKATELDEEVGNYLQEISIYVQFVTQLRELLSLPEDAASGEIVVEVRATQQRAMSALVLPKLEENQIMFTIDEPHLSLLKATVSRLSEKYDATVTMKDVLLDMFARYTIEQYSEWFYPFVVNGNDFKTITGYTQNELKAWLKTK